ncbi:MAG: HPr family phosphocarrier protein [Thermoanaerobaculia bacterium]|nr:HPr family phosphocarrier protein [Thermoanaerobaculia bacterium]
MIEQTIEIVNRLGLHARAAAKLVHLAGTFRSRVTIEVDGEEVDAKSILGILLLAAGVGTTVIVRATGDDEAAAITGIVQLFADKFGEGE